MSNDNPTVSEVLAREKLDKKNAARDARKALRESEKLDRLISKVDKSIDVDIDNKKEFVKLVKETKKEKTVKSTEITPISTTKSKPRVTNVSVKEPIENVENDVKIIDIKPNISKEKTQLNVLKGIKNLKDEFSLIIEPINIIATKISDLYDSNKAANISQMNMNKSLGEFNESLKTSLLRRNVDDKKPKNKKGKVEITSKNSKLKKIKGLGVGALKGIWKILPGDMTGDIIKFMGLWLGFKKIIGSIGNNFKKIITSSKAVIKSTKLIIPAIKWLGKLMLAIKPISGLLRGLALIPLILNPFSLTVIAITAAVAAAAAAAAYMLDWEPDFEKSKASWKKLKESKSLVEYGDNLVLLFSDLWADFKGSIKWSKEAKALFAKAASAYEWLVIKKDEIAASMKKYVSDFVEGVKTRYNTMVADTKKWIEEIDVMKTLQTYFDNFVEGVKTRYNTMVADTKKWIEEIDVIKTIQTYFDNFVEGVKTKFNTMVADTKKWMEEIDVVKTIKDAFNDFVDMIIEMIPTWEDMKGYMVGLATDNRAVNWVKDLFEKKEEDRITPSPEANASPPTTGPVFQTVTVAKTGRLKQTKELTERESSAMTNRFNGAPVIIDKSVKDSYNNSKSGGVASGRGVARTTPQHTPMDNYLYGIVRYAQ